MPKPAMRMTVRHKDSGATAEVGVFWESKYGYNFSPCLEDVDHPKYPKRSLLSVLKNANKFFFNVNPIRTRDEAASEPEDDGFNDDFDHDF